MTSVLTRLTTELQLVEKLAVPNEKTRDQKKKKKAQFFRRCTLVHTVVVQIPHCVHGSVQGMTISLAAIIIRLARVALFWQILSHSGAGDRNVYITKVGRRGCAAAFCHRVVPAMIVGDSAATLSMKRVQLFAPQMLSRPKRN